MSSVGNAYEDQSKLSYLATRTFENDLFGYTTAINSTTFERTGTLSAPISGATALTCPVGRFLYETGKKLIPGAHPGVKTLMVGVFDPVSFLSGFIDPNSEVFTRMNEDKSAMLDTITAAGTLDYGVFGRNPNGNTSDLADPVYTRGDVTALGQATITSNITSLTGDIIAAKQIRSGVSTYAFTSESQDITIDISTYTTQNIKAIWTHTASNITGCTFGFNAPGTIGDSINLYLSNNSATRSLTFDAAGGGSNVSYPTSYAAFGTPAVSPLSNAIFKYTSDGTKWICTEFGINY